MYIWDLAKVIYDRKDFLIKRMDELNLTLQELANKMFITKSTLSRKLNGQRDWKLSDLIELKKVLKLNDEEFMSIFINNELNLK